MHSAYSSALCDLGWKTAFCVLFLQNMHSEYAHLSCFWMFPFFTQIVCALSCCQGLKAKKIWSLSNLRVICVQPPCPSAKFQLSPKFLALRALGSTHSHSFPSRLFPFLSTCCPSRPAYRNWSSILYLPVSASYWHTTPCLSASVTARGLGFGPGEHSLVNIMAC